MPAQNASGNWIKIVQRVPVRIDLDAKEVAAHPLRIGISVDAEVDVTDATGPVVSTNVRSQPAPSLATGEDPAIAARIGEIIAANVHPAAEGGRPRTP